MAYSPSEDSAAASELVSQCLSRWDTGGRESLYEAFMTSTMPSETDPPPLCSFARLWKALLFSHAFTPRLNSSAFESLIKALPSVQDAPESHEVQNLPIAIGAPGSAGPSKRSLHLGQDSVMLKGQEVDTAMRKSHSAFADTILDMIWAVDVEIDLRAELSTLSPSSGKQSDEANKGKARKRESPTEVATAAKGRLAELVRSLITSSCLSRVAVAERLEVPMLAAVGLITDEALFNKKGVRINTANLYKQQKFNLLREENEGYSGLINELLSGMGPQIIALYDVPFDKPHNWHAAPARIVEQETAKHRNYRARAVMRNISALIGYFDLDPNRVLDIVLDTFASNVTLHWPFFVSLMAASPWTREKRAGQQNLASAGGDYMDVDASALIGGNHQFLAAGRNSITCAQVLGFKFDYYRLPETREDVPAEMYMMAALLIKEGFVDLADIWNHLSPSEEGMKALQSSYNTALKDKAASARSNALSMAAPLADEDDGAEAGANARSDISAEMVSKDPPNQIVGMLKALLSLGELKDAQFILGLYPWLVGAFAEVADLFTRLVKTIINPIYQTISCSIHHNVMADEFLNGAKMRFNVQRQALFPSPPPRLVPTSFPIEPVGTAYSRFVFAFGDGWTRKLPSLHSLDAIEATLLPCLRLLGVHLHCNAALFQRICRLGKAHLLSLRRASEPDEAQAQVKATWLEIVRFHLFPALSLTSGNAGLLNELWGLLQLLPYTERFSLYGEWKNELYKWPEVRYRQMETEKEAKGILKRISKDNLKTSGRALAKASHANPLIFFTIALNQVQVYDNMIPHIVECAKYLTSLEYDVFSFNLIDALSNPEKERTKQDGTNISLWLKSLASFAGTLYRRYTTMDPTPVLQYIVNQLKANNSKDLVIIRELVLKMAGIEPLANLADKQIAALSGGRTLRMEAMMAANAGPGTPARQQIRRTGARLLESLKHSRLAVALLVLIAQQRQVCIHLVPEQEAHLRYLGNLADSCQEVLFQYVEFLHSQIEPAAYAELVPNLRALCIRFDIEPAIAFHIARPRLLHAMKQAEEIEAERKLRAELLASKIRASSPLAGDKAEGGEAIVDTDNGSKTDNAITASSIKQDAKGSMATVGRAGLEEAIGVASELLSEEVKRVLTPHYFATFWQLSLADIQVPTERYEQEMRVYQQLMKEVDTGDSSKRSTAYRRHQESLEQLRAELKARTLAHQATRRRLLAEKDHWFPRNDGTTRRILVQHLIQHCFIPRALVSPTDAMFAGKFIRLMHLNGAPNFSSLTLYDRLFIEHISPVVFSCTENEANSYARFLQVVLDDLMPWYKSQQLFDKEIIGNNLPGFQMRWGNRRGGEPIPKEAMCTYDQFKDVMRKWHEHLRTAFKLCLTSTDFMRTRNAIVVMTRIQQHFPLFDAHGQSLIQLVEKLTAEESRGSLKVLGQGLLATLKKRQSQWIGKSPKVPDQTQAVASESASHMPSVPANRASEPSSAAAAVIEPAQRVNRGAEASRLPSPSSAAAPDQREPPSGPAADRGRAPSSSVPPSAAIPSGPAADQRKTSQARLPDAQSQQREPASFAVGNRNSRLESSASASRPVNGSVPSSGSPLPARPFVPGRQWGRTADASRDNDRSKASGESAAGTQSRQTPPTAASDVDMTPAEPTLPIGPRGKLEQPETATTARASTTISAARQAALDSMNPTASPASTSAAQAKWDKAAPEASERERTHNVVKKPSSRPSSPSRARNGEVAARSSVPSRDPSPKLSRQHEVDMTGTRARDGRREREDRDRENPKERRDRIDRDSRDSRDVPEREKDRPERRRVGDSRRSGQDGYEAFVARERAHDKITRDERRDEEALRRSRDEVKSQTGKSGGELANPRSSRDAHNPPRGPTVMPTTSVEDATAAAYKRRRVDLDEVGIATTLRSPHENRGHVSGSARVSEVKDIPTGPAKRNDGRTTSPIVPRAELSNSTSRSVSKNVTGSSTPTPSIASFPASRDDAALRGIDLTRGRRSAGDSAPHEEGLNSPSGIKRSLADRLSGQERMTSPASSLGSPVNDEHSPHDGPEQKRAKMSRHRFSDAGVGRPSAALDPIRTQEQKQQRGSPEGAAAPAVRSVSISGSAARERERRATQGTEGHGAGDRRAPPTGPSSNSRGDKPGRMAEDRDRDRDGGLYGRRRGREEGRSFKDRSRRRAGED